MVIKGVATSPDKCTKETPCWRHLLGYYGTLAAPFIAADLERALAEGSKRRTVKR